MKQLNVWYVNLFIRIRVMSWLVVFSTYYTVRDEYDRMVCRCSLTAYGKKYAELIAKLLKRTKENGPAAHNS